MILENLIVLQQQVKQPAGLPRARNAAGADHRRAHFVALGAGDAIDFDDELRRLAEVDVQDGRHLQWRKENDVRGEVNALPNERSFERRGLNSIRDTENAEDDDQNAGRPEVNAGRNFVHAVGARVHAQCGGEHSDR